VWSLGLALLECATGRFPYPPETSDDGDGDETAPRAPPKTLGFWDLLDHIVREPAPTLPASPSRASLAKRALVVKKKAGDARKKTNDEEPPNEDDADESGGAPTIVAFSRAFREVTELCLQKRPERRAGASALLASAWLAGADAERGRAILAETVRSANQRA
jgi:serine/threonine protein kinase